LFLIEIAFKKIYQRESVDRLALEINPAIAGSVNSGRNAKNIIMKHLISWWVYCQLKLLSIIIRTPTSCGLHQEQKTLYFLQDLEVHSGEYLL